MAPAERIGFLHLAAEKRLQVHAPGKTIDLVALDPVCALQEGFQSRSVGGNACRAAQRLAGQIMRELGLARPIENVVAPRRKHRRPAAGGCGVSVGQGLHAMDDVGRPMRHGGGIRRCLEIVVRERVAEQFERDRLAQQAHARTDDFDALDRLIDRRIAKQRHGVLAIGEKLHPAPCVNVFRIPDVGDSHRFLSRRKEPRQPGSRHRNARGAPGLPGCMSNRLKRAQPAIEIMDALRRQGPIPFRLLLCFSA
ncbi:MAG: hypothetical protein BWZ10_03185 [candidate division BRC1 bacterium ADurb.BinA364]|nr:MAG: hypothetical protein BWZ10_03185 [candidate division BRC1 bacterium ADurb.BinA364]